MIFVKALRGVVVPRFGLKFQAGEEKKVSEEVGKKLLALNEFVEGTGKVVSPKPEKKPIVEKERVTSFDKEGFEKLKKKKKGE